MRILVAEDNPTSRAALVDLLRAEGHDPRAVGNGREAVASCRRDVPDLLILDYRLPDMSGLEVLAQIDPCCRRGPPALLVTAHGLSLVAREAAAGFGARIFSKPVSPRELLEFVRATVRPSLA